jgi:hypothetical protein
MALIIDDLPSAIRQAKKELRAALPNYREVFAEVEEAISAEAKRIAGQRDQGARRLRDSQRLPPRAGTELGPGYCRLCRAQ